MLDPADVAQGAPLLAFALSTHLLLWYQKVARPVVHLVRNANACYVASPEHVQRSERHVADIQSVLQQCPALHSTYFPPLCFFGGFSQLVPFLLESWWRAECAPPCVWREELAELEDGELISLDWANEVPGPSDTDAAPFLIIHHGASGSTTDFPNQTYVEEAVRRGWLVCVFNRRGHKRVLSRPRFSFFGSTADTRRVTQRYFRERRPAAPVFMLGISAGSGLLARYMGEQGLDTRPKNEIEGFCTAAVGVSPGYDIEVCFSRIKPPFASILMNGGKAFFLEKNEALLKSCESYDACMDADTAQKWIDHTWSMTGHTSTADFYEKTNPMRVIDKIREPFLCLNAEDDPLCVGENISENLHIFDDREHNAAIAVTKTGSHCAFYELSPFNASIFPSSWSEKVLFQFFESVLRHADHMVTPAAS